MIPACGPPNSL
ncbi:hypothetical protein YPPY46_4558, partial [Yersinia pestis PY-46]